MAGMKQFLSAVKARILALNERLKGFRTFIVAALLGIVGVIEQTPWAELIPEPYKKWALVIIPVIFFLLRFVSNRPAGPQQ